MSGRVAVVGSTNVDSIYRLARIPSPGETVTALQVSHRPGGKGLNQALAAHRAGVEVTFISAVGSDSGARLVRRMLEEEGLSATHVRKVEAPTGAAVVMVESSGENSIIVQAGANASLTRLTGADVDSITSSDVLVMQLEVPSSILLEAAHVARRSGCTTVLNPSPVRKLPRDLLELVDVLVLNEHESEQIPADLDATILRITTLGAKGAQVQDGAGKSIHIAPRPTAAVDTTGAGDTFVGALVADLAQGSPIAAAARRAVVAASLSVERHGATASIPTRAEVDQALLAVGK